MANFVAMKRDALVLITLLILQSADAIAQIADRFRHAVGASAHFIPFEGGGVSAPFGVYYEPQFNVIDRYSDFSLAVCSPLTLGAHVGNSFIPRTYFYGHLPLVAEANLGHFSTKRFYNDIGTGVGVGYAMQINGLDVASGPVFTVAARVWASRVSLTVRYMFHYNVTGIGFDTHSLAVAVNLGTFFKKLRADNALEKWQRPR